MHSWLATGLIAFAPLAPAESMPPAQQTALVMKYCAVCHNDAHVNGGLTLEHFDAAHADPTLMAMLLSKVKDGGAITAAGMPRPDHATEEALVRALTAGAAGATEWNMTRTQPQTLAASIVRQTPSTKYPINDVFRLTVTCRADTHDGPRCCCPGRPALPPKTR